MIVPAFPCGCLTHNGFQRRTLCTTPSSALCHSESFQNRNCFQPFPHYHCRLVPGAGRCAPVLRRRTAVSPVFAAGGAVSHPAPGRHSGLGSRLGGCAPAGAAESGEFELLLHSWRCKFHKLRRGLGFRMVLRVSVSMLFRHASLYVENMYMPVGAALLTNYLQRCCALLGYELWRLASVTRITACCAFGLARCQCNPSHGCSAITPCCFGAPANKECQMLMSNAHDTSSAFAKMCRLLTPRSGAWWTGTGHLSGTSPPA